MWSLASKKIEKYTSSRKTASSRSGTPRFHRSIRSHASLLDDEQGEPWLVIEDDKVCSKIAHQDEQIEIVILNCFWNLQTTI